MYTHQKIKLISVIISFFLSLPLFHLFLFSLLPSLLSSTSGHGHANTQLLQHRQRGGAGRRRPASSLHAQPLPRQALGTPRSRSCEWHWS